MITLSNSDIERAFLKFRVGRRLIIDKLLEEVINGEGITKRFLMLSRFFCRLKSADSVLEKINRKGIIISDVSDIPTKVPDILGFRIITENIDELRAIDKFLKNNFEVVSRLDMIAEPNEFGYRSIEYSLQYHFNGEIYPFEIQLRTFLQHYWSTQSFHLFHKKPRETALKYKEILLSLSQSLNAAEQDSIKLCDTIQINKSVEKSTWQNLPICREINLVVVETGEQFVNHIILPLVDDDIKDHDAIVKQKLELYTIYPNAAIVECSFLNFSSFQLNEPHVIVHSDLLEKIVF